MLNQYKFATCSRHWWKRRIRLIDHSRDESKVKSHSRILKWATRIITKS